MKPGLGAKIFASTAFVVVAVLGGALFITKQRADRAADASIDRALEATHLSIQDALAGRSQSLRLLTAGLAQVPTYVARVAEAVRTNNLANLLDQADEFREQTGAAWTLITDDRGILKAWTLHPDLVDEDLSEGALVGLALGGEQTEGVWIEPAPDGDEIYQAVGIPIFAPGRQVVYGVVVAALPIDDEFVSSLKRHTNSDIVFFALDTLDVAHATVATLPVAAIDSALAQLDADAVLEEGDERVRVRMPVAGDMLIGAVGALYTAGGFPVGGYIGFRSWTVELAPFTQLQETILQVFLAGLLLALISSLVLARTVTRPVKRLVELTQQVAEGQYSGEIAVRSRDEIGQLAQAFRKMLAELKEKQQLVEYLTAGISGKTVSLSDAEARAVTGAGASRPAGAPVRTGVIEVGGVFAGRYKIQQVLGQGGMGVVYRAFDREVEEQVAIKTLKPEMLQVDGTMLERFKREIRLARRITHRNVVRTHDLGEVDGMYYITMEYVEGTNLKDLIIKRGRLPLGVTLTVGKQLCRALEVAHEQGVVHRDIKPQNIVVEPSGFIKVMDFGIARLAERSQKPGEGLTEVGTAIGTPEYMAPEQLMGEEVDERADIYAAGAVLFECVTGKTVFTAPTVPALMMKHLEEAPTDPRTINPDVPEALSSVILKALAKQRDNRWAGAMAMYRALESVEVGAPEPAR